MTTREATLRRWEQLQRSARHEVRSFDRPPYVMNADNQVEREMLAAGVTYRAVYHRDGFAVPGRPARIRAMIEAGEQARLTENVPVKMFIADNRLGLIPLEVAGSADASLLIHESSMLDTLIALFDLVWERAIPIHADGELPAPAQGPGADESALLGLLAAGLTDSAIARHLGTHPRTVQRRVRELLDHLGAGTRFQAGLQAVRRGWLEVHPGFDPPSSSPPRATSRADIGASVAPSGRGVPPTEHDDVFGRRARPPTEHNDVSRPDRLAARRLRTTALGVHRDLVGFEVR